MKNIILILFLIALVSCSKKNEGKCSPDIKITKPEITDQAFKKNLAANHFFRYAEPNTNTGQIDSLEIYNENTNKFVQIDAEELAEFSFDGFVPQLSKMLARRNIILVVKKSAGIEKTHEISINQEKVILYTKTELQNGSFWNAAAHNFFKKVNQILEKKDSDERFYLVYEGNDLSALLLTNFQHELFVLKYESEPGEIPYKP